MSKDFLTYNQQMKYLRDNKHINCGGSNHKEILVRCGYFNIVNGYKIPFTNGKDPQGHHIYIANTNIDEIYALKCFDDDLRLLLFKYITRVESEIRALSAYSFDNLNKGNSLTWYNVTAYDTTNVTDVIKLISKIYSKLSGSPHSYVTNYLYNHNLIPTWIMIKVIDLSHVIDFIKLAKPKIKDNLCDLYSMKQTVNGNIRSNYTLLVGSLHWLRIIRNSCAHNERVYDICMKNKHIKDNYFDLMANSYNNERDKKIIDAIVYFKYFLSHDQFEGLISNLKDLLQDLSNKINQQSFNEVRAAMGIKDVMHLDLILQQPKNIRYNFHS